MRPTEFSADTIIALLRKQTIASLSEVMAALGARASRRTAFRKLKDIDARTSYSHRGGFYTLDELAHFDERGLWSFAGVRFSRAGTLIATTESFISVESRVTAHSGRVGLASELTSRGASTTDVMLAGNWKTSRMVAHYSAGATAERGAVARYL